MDFTLRFVFSHDSTQVPISECRIQRFTASVGIICKITEIIVRFQLLQVLGTYIY